MNYEQIVVPQQWLTVLDNLHQAAEVGQNGAAHEDGDLLHNLDASVAGLPGLLAFAHGFEEGQQRGDAEGGGHHREGSGRGVSHVLVHVVNVWSHRWDHGRQASSLWWKTRKMTEFQPYLQEQRGGLSGPARLLYKLKNTESKEE